MIIVLTLLWPFTIFFWLPIGPRALENLPIIMAAWWLLLSAVHSAFGVFAIGLLRRA